MSSIPETLKDVMRAVARLVGHHMLVIVSI